MRRRIYVFKCRKCGLIIRSESSSPDPRVGGPCPRSIDGKHSWYRIGEEYIET